MTNQLQSKLDLFTENILVIRDDFIWQEAAAKRLVALVYTLDGKKIDNSAIREAHNMIKSEVGVLSVFRGNFSIFVAAALSLANDKNQLFADTLAVYETMKGQGFRSNDFLGITAFEIAVNAESTQFSDIAARTMEFYKEMKANHRFLVSANDYIFAALMALAGLEPHDTANKLKQLYIHLKDELSFWLASSSILTLAQMLVLGGSTDECVRNMLRLNRTLRNHKIRLDKAHTLPTLGVLTMLNVDHSQLVDDIETAVDFLRKQKGLGVLSVTTQEILLHITALITYANAGDNALSKAAAISGTTNLLIAQQVAIISSIAATSAIAASSS